MSFRKRLRKKIKRAGRVALAGATLGGSEIIRHRKEITGFVKEHPQEVGFGLGALFGAPMIGASLGGAFGQARAAYKGEGEFPSLPDPSSLGSIPEESEGSISTARMSPPIKPTTLLVGGLAFIALATVFVTRK